MKTSFEMGQKVLNEEQMREYVESEVRKALMSEGIDEGLGGDVMNWIMGKLMKSGRVMQFISNYLKQNMKLEDLIGLAVRTFGASAIINLICKALGIEANGVLGQAVKSGLAAVVGMATGGLNTSNPSEAPVATTPAAEGNGGTTSPTGGAGFSGGGFGGGSR